MINLNDMAKEIAMLETGAQEISIAQIKEVLKLVLEDLAEEDICDVIKLLRKYRDDEDEY